MITNLSLPFSLFYTLLPHPRIIHSYEITSDSNIEPGNWPRTVQRLESVAEILSIHGARMARENGPIILEEGSIYGEREKWRRKIAGISLLPVSRSISYYRIIIALERVISGCRQRYWKKCWTLITFPDDRMSNACNA